MQSNSLPEGKTNKVNTKGTCYKYTTNAIKHDNSPGTTIAIATKRRKGRGRSLNAANEQAFNTESRKCKPTLSTSMNGLINEATPARKDHKTFTTISFNVTRNQI